jgi:hypothetical protein
MASGGWIRQLIVCGEEEICGQTFNSPHVVTEWPTCINKYSGIKSGAGCVLHMYCSTLV